VNRRRFITTLLFVATSPVVARALTTPKLSPFARSWNIICDSLRRQWDEGWLRINERVKLHREGATDVQIAGPAEQVIAENRIQEAGLKTLVKG
jgi:hypothetical protein